MRSIFERASEKFTIGEGCWIWTGATNGIGYGHVRQRRADGTWGQGYAHRVVYETLVGPIPDGAVLDHLCRTPSCVNPDHLEPVTQGENLARGATFNARHIAQEACVNGHPFDDANTYLWRGSRYCRACRRDRTAAFRAARATGAQ